MTTFTAALLELLRQVSKPARCVPTLVSVRCHCLKWVKRNIVFLWVGFVLIRETFFGASRGRAHWRSSPHSRRRGAGLSGAWCLTHTCRCRYSARYMLALRRISAWGTLCHHHQVCGQGYFEGSECGKTQASSVCYNKSTNMQPTLCALDILN